jgi:hypothetical protein
MSRSFVRVAGPVLVFLVLQVPVIRGSCSIALTQLAPLNGGHRFRATITHDTPGLSLTLQLQDSVGNNVRLGPARECFASPCSVETEFSCIPENSAKVWADSSGHCNAMQPLSAASTPPPRVVLDGDWVGEQFQISATYDIQPGNGFVSLTLQLLDTSGAWIDAGFDPTPRMGDGVKILSLFAQPGIKFRIKAAPGCGFLTRDDMIGLSNALEVPNRDDFELEAKNLTLSLVAETKRVSGTAEVTVPLGTRFSLGLVKVEGGIRKELSSDFRLGPLLTLDSALEDPTSYASNILLEFDEQATAQQKAFQAMHLGSQNVIITTDEGPSQVVLVNVVRPLRLGSTGNTVTFNNATYNLDDLLVTWGHKRGMPPQIAKAIVQHETLPFLNVMTYRYEPLSTDYQEFSPRGQEHRKDSIYQFVRMEYDNFPRGANLIDAEDVHPRSRFNIDKTTTPKTKIPDSEQMVTAKTIYDNNDYWQNWSKFIPSGRAQAIAKDPDLELGWSAQTTIAASYGLMQVLYPETAELGGGVINGQRRPYYLFDRPEHVAAGAGSIPTGTAVWAHKFRLANLIPLPTDPCAPAFKTAEEMDKKIQRASYLYNGSRQYGEDIMTYQLNYLPIPTGPMLP